ncbi:MAG: hypothetical protein KJZ54_13365 [Phycisphaerales bacterium]|nr:hypothetical protein [Phycisphaerales bacterium]
MARLVILSGKVEDDRGARHAMRTTEARDKTSFRLTRGTISLVNSEARPGPAERSLAVRRRLLRVGAGTDINTRRFRLGLVVAEGAVLVLIAISYFAFRVAAGVLLALAAVIPVIMLAAQSERRAVARDRASLAALPPVCVACGQDLTGVPAHPDGCTVCPECGAAWRLHLPQGGPVP